MTASGYEYELKYLSSHPRHLLEFLGAVRGKFTNASADVHQKLYYFDTTYLDKDDRFRRAGFSLRKREGVNGHIPSVELKSLEGLRRIELTERHPSHLVAFFNLLARPDYPLPAPRIPCPIDMMDTIMVIGAKRFSIETEFLPVRSKLEIAYDQIFYNGKDKDPDEHEVEFEFKDISDEQFDKIVDFFRTEIEPRYPNVQRTTLSKAQRGYNRHEPTPQAQPS